jgi:hypothetical protein
MAEFTTRDETRIFYKVGGPRTIETYRSPGALDELRLMVLPMFVETGCQLTPELSTDTGLDLIETRGWPGSVTELVYEVRSEAA